MKNNHVIKPELSKVCCMTEVDAELQRWEALEGYSNEYDNSRFSSFLKGEWFLIRCS